MTLKIGLTLALAAWTAAARADEQMPAGMTHEQHLREMAKDADLDRRGADAMGFDQRATEHHFILTSQGGAIVVTVRNPADAENRRAIRTHLQEIARQFAAGDFGKPQMTHGQAPDGVAELVARREAITYSFVPLADGGQVRLTTSDAGALGAVHAFLQYQIREHKTGDPLTVPK